MTSCRTRPRPRSRAPIAEIREHLHNALSKAAGGADRDLRTTQSARPGRDHPTTRPGTVGPGERDRVAHNAGFFQKDFSRIRFAARRRLPARWTSIHEMPIRTLLCNWHHTPIKGA